MKKSIKNKALVLISFLFVICSLLSVVFFKNNTEFNVAHAEELATAYNNDYNNLQYVTRVKDQNPYGICWAFSAVACAEVDAVKNHGASAFLTDFSEWHLAYFTYQGERAGTGDKVEEVDYEYYNAGGYDRLSSLVLSTGIGFTNEIVAPYAQFKLNSNATIDQSKMYSCDYRLKNMFTLDPDNITAIKEKVLEYGAVAIGYHNNEDYLNKTTYANYCSIEDLPANHEVVIVGWDDNYSAENFNYFMRPTKNGAFLVKNSWGTSWGLKGYFWLSYEDKSISTASVFDVEPVSNSKYVYQHDGGISSEYFNSGAKISRVANLFTCESDEKLTAVSISTYCYENKPYTLKIYQNPTSNDTSKPNFEWDNLAYTQTGTLANLGYNTIVLDTPLLLKAGDVFVVEIQTEAKIGIDVTQTVQAKSGNNLVSIAQTTSAVGDNQSFYCDFYGKWHDAFDQDDEEKFNLRIKAFTVDAVIGTPKISINPSLSQINYGEKLSKSEISGGLVIDDASSKVIDGEWTFENPEHIPISAQSVTLIFTPKDKVYEPLTVSVSVSVNKVQPKITLTFSENRVLAGQTLWVYVSVSNQYNGQLTDLGSVILTYQIEGDEQIYQVENKKINAPIDAENKKITVTAKVNGVENKYLENTIVREITIEKSIGLLPHGSNYILHTAITLGAIAVLYVIFVIVVKKAGKKK